MLLYNPYDLIIIEENVIPPENIEELMLLTNNTEDITQATIINNFKEEGGTTNLKTRNTLWYAITEEMAQKLEIGISTCFKNFIVPKYNNTVILRHYHNAIVGYCDFMIVWYHLLVWYHSQVSITNAKMGPFKD